MYDYDVSLALSKIAQADMRLARNDGFILIAQTKHGTVTLSYDRSERSYTCVAQDGRKLFGRCAAAGCETRLVGGVYDVVVA